MLLVSIVILVLFYLIDTYLYKKEIDKAPEKEDFSLRIDGKINFILIGIIIFAVILSGQPFLQSSFLQYENENLMI